MSNIRMRYNHNLIRSFLTDPATADVVMQAARDVESGLGSVQSRVDIQNGPNRIRVAVIAGYEDGATAENTREALLRATGGAGG